MMRDVLGPKLQLAPQPSAAMAVEESNNVRTALETIVREGDMA